MTTPELQTVFTRTEDYLASYLIPQDDVLDKIRSNSKEQGLRNVAVSPAQGIFLNLLVRSLGAKRILEIGTLGAFSTVCFARGIPEDGKITTLEIDPHCAKVATDHLNLAGVLHKVDLVLGKAQETLKTLTPGYDLIFIDADEESFVDYYKLSKPLVRKGGVILVDNVVLDGRVSDLDNHDSRPEGVRRMLEAIKGDTDVSPVAIPTATRKGYDGMIYMVRN